MSEFVRRKGWEELALAFASGQTLRDAAALAHVDERTARRRLNDPAFKQHVAELRAEMINRVIGRMVQRMDEAADTLHSLLSASKEIVRLGAARSSLELPVKLHESVELEARLAALEAQARNPGTPVTPPAEDDDEPEGTPGTTGKDEV